MIRSSSSGSNSHRTAAIELIIERSIQGRRKERFRKEKSSLRSELTQPKGEAPNTPTPQVHSPPAPAPQPPSQSLPNATAEIVTSIPSTASLKCEASQDSSALSKSAKVALREEPAADAKANPSPSEDFVELVCRRCDVKQLRKNFRYIVCCPCNFPKKSSMTCTGCRTDTVRNVDVCTGCHKRFK